MRLFATTDEKEFQYQWKKNDSKNILFKNDEIENAELIDLGNGRATLIKNNRTYRVVLMKNESAWHVQVDGQNYTVVLENERSRKTNALRKNSNGQNNQHIKAPIAGLVVQVHKAVGDTAKKGETLIVLEAMKMENSLKAPYDCTIKEIRIKEAETVHQKQTLLVLENL